MVLWKYEIVLTPDVFLLTYLLDPLDSCWESNASNDKASSALRPVSNAQQMPPSSYVILPRNTYKGSYGINYIVVASVSAPYMIDH